MTDKELLQQALEALESDNPDIQLRTAIEIRTRLAQPEPEPVAITDDDGNAWAYGIQGGKLPSGLKLYTTPPKKEWVGLTDDEIKEALSDMSSLQMPFNKLIPAIARAIEAKLKEKNGG